MFRFISRFSFLLNLLLVLYTLLVFQLSYEANVQHWIGGFLMLTLPLAILLNVVFIFIWIISGSKRWLLSVFCLLIGYPFMERTFQWPFSGRFATTSEKKLSVLSYNLMWGDASKYFEKRDSANTVLMLQTITEMEADVKCLQEVYNNDKAWGLRILKKVSKKNPYYTYIHSTPGNVDGQGEIGLAVFSKYPIINKQEIYWKPNHNGVLSVDILKGKDTLRIINVQLYSMGIRVEKVINTDDEDLAKKEAKNIFYQLKKGFEKRAHQVKTLESLTDECHYPLIVSGDFNEMPYGFAYGRLRNKLNNAFEERGSGFGFTYNHLLNFLRIDNQFYGKGFKVINFRTFNNVKYSDHYPIYGEYLY